MRTLLVLSTMAVLTACSTADQGSSVSGVPGWRGRPFVLAAPEWGVTSEVKFWRDQRPADGNLVEIILTKRDDGKYDAVKHVVTAGMDGNVQDTTDEVATGLSCENQFADEIGTLTGVRCAFDGRPVDGSLIEVLFQIDSEGTYSARRIVTPARMIEGAEPRVAELGEQLAISFDAQAAEPIDPPMTCMAYWTGWEFDPTTGKCEERGTSGCSNPFQYTEKAACEAAAQPAL